MGDNSPSITVQFSQIQTILYVDKNAIKTYGADSKYVKIDLTYDAGNNNAFLKYGDINYYPHSVNVFKIDANTIRLIIETRNERSSNAELMYLCANLQQDTNRNSISTFASALKNTNRTPVQFKMTDIFGGEDQMEAKAVLTQDGPNSQRYTCILGTPVNVDQETWSIFHAMLTVFNAANISSILAGIKFDTSSAANVILKRSSLDTVMDCQPITGDDQADMKTDNVNGTITREQLFSETVLLLAVMGVIMSSYVMFFEDILQVGLLNFMKDPDMGLIHNSKYSMNITTLFWYCTIIPFSIVMIIFSMTKHTTSHMIGGIIMLLLLALSNYLYKYRISYNIKLTINESDNFTEALNAFVSTDVVFFRIFFFVFGLASLALGITTGIHNEYSNNVFNLWMTTYLSSNTASFYANSGSPLSIILMFTAIMLFVASIVVSSIEFTNTPLSTPPKKA